MNQQVFDVPPIGALMRVEVEQKGERFSFGGRLSSHKLVTQYGRLICDEFTFLTGKAIEITVDRRYILSMVEL